MSTNQHSREWVTGFNDGYNAAQAAQTPRVNPSIAHLADHSSTDYRVGWGAGCNEWDRQNAEE